MNNTNDVEKYSKVFDDLINVLPDNFNNFLSKVNEKIKADTQEIRIRVNAKITLVCSQEIQFINLVATKYDIQKIFNNICQSSVYAFQEQIKNGFITFKGGHRIGLGGHAVIEKNEIFTMKDITSLNIRIAKEFKNSSYLIFNNIKENSLGTLIVGSPSTGKTTLLRDLARLLSIEISQKVTIVDERAEIAAVYNGEPQMDIGFADILTGFPKDVGILRAIRCLSPDSVICDEIGNLKNTKAITESLNAGVKIIATIHAKNLRELMFRPQALLLLKSGAFETVVFLSDSSQPGKVSKIFKVSEIVKC